MRSKNIKRNILYFAISLLAVYFLTIILSMIFGLNIGGQKRNKIGLIKLEGVIISSSSFIDQLKEVKKDDDMAAIVIRIDSPGGAVAPSQEIYTELLKFKEKTKKKVVASLASVGASGGYYIACAADKIIANPGSMTGSIGAIIKLQNLKDLFEKIGYEEQVIKSGKFKDIGSYSRKLTNEERELFQGLVDDIHQQFIESVAKSRDLKIEDIKKIADGRIFTGQQAMEFHLIDSLGTLEDAI
ncbi:MAG: signal peptide peptidase SppA, partial [bacterium]